MEEENTEPTYSRTINLSIETKGRFEDERYKLKKSFQRNVTQDDYLKKLMDDSKELQKIKKSMDE